MTSQARYDVVIVGARCAGATFLARAGASVSLLDKERRLPSPHARRRSSSEKAA
jgi:flavin-dependent dehydrogenase